MILASWPGATCISYNKTVYIVEFNVAIELVQITVKALPPTPNLGNELTFIKNKRCWAVLSLQFIDNCIFAPPGQRGHPQLGAGK